MRTLKDEFEILAVGEPVHYRNLTLIPLLRPCPAQQADYLLLDDAIGRGLATVTELDGGGSVPEIRFENRADRPVLLVDGEELIGAKQNRVLNLSVLAGPMTTTVIPVSCVEAGRWHAESREFRAAPHILYSRARRSKGAAVTASMRSAGSRRSDQTALWNELACKATSVGADSQTQAMAFFFERNALELADFERAFNWREDQAGVVCAVSGTILGLDLFDRPETMRRVMPKLVRSYAMDALDAPARQKDRPGRAQASAFLKAIVDAPNFSAPAVGLGKDLRIVGAKVSGAALWALDRYIHICAFASDSRTAGLSTRMSRPTHRSAIRRFAR